MADPPPPPPLSTAPPPIPATSSPHTNSSFNAADPPPQPPPKLRLMCSYGGHIVPRPHDKTLCYVGGDTRIIVVDRHTSLSDLHRRLSRNLFDNQPFSLKYQLPSEDLDSLITVTSDEDFENMVEEYDRLLGGAKAGRLRLFLFPKSSSSNLEHLLVENNSSKSGDWFFDALNGGKSASNLSAAASDREFSETSSVNYLLGLDDDDDDLARSKSPIMEKGSVIEAQLERSKTAGGVTGNGNFVANNQELQYAVADLETTSSFGSASSSPSIANLPSLRVHAAEENQKIMIEEQFQQMSVTGVAGNANSAPRQEEIGGFAAVVSGLPVVVGGGEYGNRVFSDDERSDHGGYGKVQHMQPQVQAQLQPQQIPQFQQRQTGGFDLPSPDSVSSEGSVTNPLPRERQATYQEQLTRIHSANARIISSNQTDQAAYQEQLMRIHSANARLSSNQTDPNTGNQSNSNAQMQPQVQESNYVLSNQYDQTYPHPHQSQQFIHAGNNQYIPANAVPITSYYPMYPPTQQHHPKQPVLDQQYPVVINGRQQSQAYSLSMQQPTYSELAPSNPNNPQTPYPKPEMPGGMYRTTAPQFVQGQYVGYNQIHPPSFAVSSNYTYEIADQTHAQMYYMPPPAQYQVPSAVTDASAQLSREAS